MGIVNKTTFEKMVNENIDWLNQYPDSLEKSHIIGIMKEFTTKFYSDEHLEQKEKVDSLINKFNFLFKHTIDMKLLEIKKDLEDLRKCL